MGVVCLLSGMGCSTMTLPADLWGRHCDRVRPWSDLLQVHMWSSFRIGLEH